MSSDDRHNPGEKNGTQNETWQTKNNMVSINDWTEISTVESLHMALNRDSWRERTWQVVLAADTPGGVGPDGRRWMSE